VARATFWRTTAPNAAGITEKTVAVDVLVSTVDIRNTWLQAAEIEPAKRKMFANRRGNLRN
jgi:hypothetical protein